MRPNVTDPQARLERVVQILTLLSFALSCWTLNRALRPRPDCVTSTVLRAVVIEDQVVGNCAFESRLQIGGARLSPTAHRYLRQLEDTAGIERWFRREPRAVITIDQAHSRAFEAERGGARIGVAWFADARQLKRAVTMALIHAHPVYAGLTPFARQTLADFIILASRAERPAAGVGFATAAPSLAGYCASPDRSPAHVSNCESRAVAADRDANAWGFESALANTLARTFAAARLRDQLRIVAGVRAGVLLPTPDRPTSTAAADLVKWFNSTTRAWAGALQMLNAPAAEQILSASLDSLGVRSPTRWELTIDLRHSPKWREIVNQLVARAHFRPRERALVFTPEGEVTLPSGRPAYWAASDVASDKHVMIACRWPAARAAVAVRADQFFARQTCGTLDAAFWD